MRFLDPAPFHYLINSYRKIRTLSSMPFIGAQSITIALLQKSIQGDSITSTTSPNHSFSHLPRDRLIHRTLCMNLIKKQIPVNRHPTARIKEIRRQCPPTTPTTTNFTSLICFRFPQIKRNSSAKFRLQQR
jgi:hypothetical protein